MDLITSGSLFDALHLIAGRRIDIVDICGPRAEARPRFEALAGQDMRMSVVRMAARRRRFHMV